MIGWIGLGCGILALGIASYALWVQAAATEKAMGMLLAERERVDYAVAAGAQHGGLAYLDVLRSMTNDPGLLAACTREEERIRDGR